MAAPRPRSLQVFAVEDTTLQLTWRDLGPGTLRISTTDAETDRAVVADTVIELGQGPGAVVIDGLPPGRPLTLVASVPGGRGPVEIPTRTLDAPPGEELTRLATISDLHLGTEVFGQLRTIVEHPRPSVPHPRRCAEAALAESAAWGSGHLVVKGDITDEGFVHQWRTFADLVADAPFPVDTLPGNHDRAHRTRAVQPNLLPEQAAASFGFPMALPLTVRDLPGIRLVLADSTTAGRNKGSVATMVDEVLDAVADADPAGSVLLALHHQLHTRPGADGWPLGVAHRESRSLMEHLGRAHPRVLVTSGHTHRHRRWDHGGVTATQVGSTKDYPGVWAGYVASEGGLRQVVRRVSRPDCLRWTDHTRRAALGAWRFIGPGRLRDRCFTITGGPA